MRFEWIKLNLEMEKDGERSGLRIKFCKGNSSSDLNGIFIDMDLWEMFKWKGLCSLDVQFSLIT